MSLGLWFAKKVFHPQRQDFYLDLAEALKDDDPLTSRIETLANRAVVHGDLIAPLYQLWLRRMDDQSFAESLAGTVPESDLMIIAASERGGDLATGLSFTSLVIDATKAMRSSLRMAVLGFFFLSFLQVVVLAGFAYFGVPLIEQIVPPDAWPMSGQILRSLAQFVTESGVLALIVAGILGAFYVWSLRNWYGKVRVWFDTYIPFYTVYRDFSGAMFLVSLAALMRNGVSLDPALDTLHVNASPWLRWHIRQIQLRLDYHSEKPGEAFATGIFNRRLTWRIIDFGARSNFAVALEKVGMKSIDEVVKQVAASAGLMNKILMFINAGLIALIICGSLLTMFEAQTHMQKSITSNSSKVQ